MSAELLREAAALMRERANAATSGRWEHVEARARLREAHEPIPYGWCEGSHCDECDTPVDACIVGALLDALEAAECERDAARAKVRQLRKGIESLIPALRSDCGSECKAPEIAAHLLDALLGGTP